jgi:hypothetical protein
LLQMRNGEGKQPALRQAAYCHPVARKKGAGHRMQEAIQ